MTQSEQAMSGILSEMTMEQVKALAPRVVVLPVGSTEPHGPHLPYGTDTYQVDAICRNAVSEANRAGARVLMYPALPIGNNVNFKAFPFACRIGVRTLMNVVLDIVEALEEDGIRRIVLVSGHGGHTDTLKATLREHAERHAPGEGAFLCITGGGSLSSRDLSGVIEHPSDHGGEGETSQMMFLRPDLVHPDKFEDFPVHPPVLNDLRSGRVSCVRPWHAYLPAGAGGETRASSAAKGQQLIEGTSGGLANFLIELSNVKMTELFPCEPPVQRKPIPAR